MRLLPSTKWVYQFNLALVQRGAFKSRESTSISMARGFVYSNHITVSRLQHVITSKPIPSSITHYVFDSCVTSDLRAQQIWSILRFSPIISKNVLHGKIGEVCAIADEVASVKFRISRTLQIDGVIGIILKLHWGLVQHLTVKYFTYFYFKRHINHCFTGFPYFVGPNCAKRCEGPFGMQHLTTCAEHVLVAWTNKNRNRRMVMIAFFVWRDILNKGNLTASPLPAWQFVNSTFCNLSLNWEPHSLPCCICLRIVPVVLATLIAVF